MKEFIDYDCNGKPLYSGDSCIVVGWVSPEVTAATGIITGSVVTVTYFPPEAREEDQQNYSISIYEMPDGTHIIGGPDEVMKLTPDATQFSSEKEKELTNA